MTRFDIDQNGWGAQKVFDDYTLYDYDKPENYWHPIEHVVHYGGGASKAAINPAWEPWALRIYEQSHLSRGWRAIAYNYGVGNSGLVYRLRGENLPGATYGVNGITKSLLWIGGGDQAPSNAAKLSIAHIINDDPMPVFPHSYYRNTNCPGDAWREWLDGFEVGSEETQDGFLNGVKEMPREQFTNLIKALFAGRPDEFRGDPAYFYLTRAEWVAINGNVDGGLYDQPTHPDWVNFWNSYVRVISNG